jgi:hypothetical protein
MEETNELDKVTVTAQREQLPPFPSVPSETTLDHVTVIGKRPIKEVHVGCDTALPTGGTVGDEVRKQRAILNNVNKVGMLFGVGPVPAIGAMAVIAWPNGPIDFKNNLRGQTSGALLGRAGNFAYYSIGSQIVPDEVLDFGAGSYAVVAAMRRQKPFSELTGPMFSDASAASVRDDALASKGCSQ